MSRKPRPTPPKVTAAIVRGIEMLAIPDVAYWIHQDELLELVPGSTVERRAIELPPWHAGLDPAVALRLARGALHFAGAYNQWRADDHAWKIAETRAKLRRLRQRAKR